MQIHPRKKQPNEATQQSLCRRLEEYIEYAQSAKRFADVGFYSEILKYLEDSERASAELRATVLKEAAYDFPAMLRKQWSGGEVRQWLMDRAQRQEKPHDPDTDYRP